METPPSLHRVAIIDKLRQTQPWLRFLGILTMVGAVFMGLGGTVTALFGGLAAAGLLQTEPANPIYLLLGLLYVVLAMVYLFPALHLIRSAKAIRGLTADSDEAAVADALESQRRFWKFAGITTIVFLVLYTLAFFAAIAVPFIAGIQKAAGHAN